MEEKGTIAKTMHYWEEREFEVAKAILERAVGFTDRVVTFDPVEYSLKEARRFVENFRAQHGLD